MIRALEDSSLELLTWKPEMPDSMAIVSEIFYKSQTLSRLASFVKPFKGDKFASHCNILSRMQNLE